MENQPLKPVWAPLRVLNANRRNKRMKRFFVMAVVAIVCCVFTIISSTSAEPQRQIAITFDDLPSVPTYDVGEMKALTTKLLKILTQNKVPAVGFVNEGKLHQRNELEARAAILKLWVDAGFELGNHTYSHLDMFTAWPSSSSRI